MWDQIKQVIDAMGGKFVIAEGGKPKYIVLSFEEFKKIIQENSLVAQDPAGADRSEDKSSADASSAISFETVLSKQRSQPQSTLGVEEFGDTPDNINQKIADLAREEEESQKIKIEDLPF